ncbi:MAG: hypothetical protein LBD16_05585 [Oscillospiraceae bacterium]|jgi:hypothetical protein|nr:hypothetical protein [Oscillospiraceae bacterium]
MSYGNDINLHDGTLVQITFESLSTMTLRGHCYISVDKDDPRKLQWGAFSLKLFDVLYSEQSMFRPWGDTHYINAFFFDQPDYLLCRLKTLNRVCEDSSFKEEFLPESPLITAGIEFQSGDMLQVLCTAVEFSHEDI